MSNKEDIDWDEARLVALLKQGSEEAFRILIRRYTGTVFSIAYGITLDREESLDIAQDVFLKIYQKVGTFREEASLSTWLHRITINQCLNWQRKWKRRFRWERQSSEVNDISNLKSAGERPDTHYEEKELERVFREWLGNLPEKARTVFVLRELEGLSYRQIAEVLKVNEGTVSSQLWNARKRLRNSLSKHNTNRKA